MGAEDASVKGKGMREAGGSGWRAGRRMVRAGETHRFHLTSHAGASLIIQRVDPKRQHKNRCHRPAHHLVLSHPLPAAAWTPSAQPNPLLTWFDFTVALCVFGAFFVRFQGVSTNRTEQGMRRFPKAAARVTNESWPIIGDCRLARGFDEQAQLYRNREVSKRQSKKVRR